MIRIMARKVGGDNSISAVVDAIAAATSLKLITTSDGSLSNAKFSAGATSG